MKTVVLGMISILMMGLLAGCSGGNDAGGSGKNDGTAAPLSIMRTYHASLEQFQGSDNINDNKLVKLLREWSGYDVEYETLPKDNVSQKLSVVLASGDVPDILWIPGKADYFKLAQQGAFEPLDELIETYIPNLEKIFTKEELDAARYEGKLYAIPHRTASKVDHGVLTRWDIFEEVGLKEPTTLDELHEAMKVIKDRKNMAPLTAAASNPGGFTGAFAPFAGAFGVGTTTIEKDGKLEFSWLQAEYKSFLTMLKQWYDEGLIDQEFAINKDVKDRMINGTAAIGSIPWYDAQMIDRSIADKNNGGVIRYIAPPVGDNGHSGYPETGLTSLYQVIPIQANNKEGAAKYFNFIFSEKADKLTTFGIEGEDYTVENDQVVQTPEQSNAIPWRTLYFLSDTDPSFFARLEAKGFLPYYEPLTGFEQNREETAYAPSIEAWDTNFTELRNYAEENAMKFIMNKRDLGEFDQFVKEFNAKGGKEAIDAMNEWYTQK
ncbi:extracellular solute-binding protein [Paenibacillus chungangensis]|uniref:Extracellular solute-binding protein n=1 Tax=Paenibacillus chungangensis TaxID=696535 RepID=A0ABW3HLU5_9BACL